MAVRLMVVGNVHGRRKKMTRDEAITWLKEMKDTIELYNDLSHSYTFDKYPQAIDMAIEALEREEKWLDDLANNIQNDTRSRNYETDTEVRLAVTDRHKNKVVLFDAFGEVEYLPTEPMTHEEAWKRIEQTDLISRADALEAIKNAKMVFDSPKDGFVKHDISDLVSTVLCEVIHDVPSVSAERVGEWEHWGSPFSEDDIINTMVCTNCGMRFVEIKGETFYYCPNCGAYMVKGAE